MAWPNNTREFVVNTGAKTSTNIAGETLVWDLPKTGILQEIYLSITTAITGTIVGGSTTGKARQVKRVRLLANAGINVCDFSGEGYHYLLRDFVEALNDPVSFAGGRSAVATGVDNLSMYIPIAINSRDPIGLLNLQNPDTQLRLEVELGGNGWLCTSGITAVTVVVTPYLGMYRMPLAKEDRPKFDFVHTMQEDQSALTSGAEFTYNWLRGNTYLSVVHGITLASTAADSFTTAALRVNQNDYLRPALPPAYFDGEFTQYRGRARVKGVVPFDLISLSGLGDYSSLRDVLNTANLTDIQSVILPSASVAMYSMKRQLVYIGEAK